MRRKMKRDDYAAVMKKAGAARRFAAGTLAAVLILGCFVSVWGDSEALSITEDAAGAESVSEGVTDSAIRRLLFDAGDDIDDLMILAKCDVTTRYESKRQKIYNNILIIEEHMKEVEAPLPKALRIAAG